ncbi:hypothetical protein HanIR_Chr15g0750791 [Helianthus annuus]|nr:hypothetical protein HanIR_Chr15g0750791 [Helianthus annuus]
MNMIATNAKQVFLFFFVGDRKNKLLVINPRHPPNTLLTNEIRMR